MSILGLSASGSRRAFELIEENVNVISKSDQPQKILDALVNLGMHPDDRDAHDTMMGKIIEVIDPNVVFIPSSVDPGIFFVYNLKDYFEGAKDKVVAEIQAGLDKKNPCASVQPTAVFKIGAQRAQMELIARKVAYLTCLSSYAICGSFYALKNPNMSKWKDESAFGEALWNGCTKEYSADQSHPEARVVGILEPFLPKTSHSKQKKKELFANIVTLALAIGWRDGHIRNKEDKKMTDTEEIMPRMLTPAYDATSHITPEEFIKIDSSKSFVAATHLPFLEDEDLTEEPMNKHDFAKLSSIVGQWNVDHIIEELSKETIRFPDFLSETEEADDDKELYDDNYCLVKILQDGFLCDDHLYDPKYLSGPTAALDENQIQAFRLRLEKIKEVFQLKKDKLTPAEVVRHVDPFYWRHLELVKTGKEILERKRTLSSSHSFGKSPKGEPSSLLRKSSQSPVEGFFSRSFSHPGRGAVPTSIMSLNTHGSREKFMEDVLSALEENDI